MYIEKPQVLNYRQYVRNLIDKSNLYMYQLRKIKQQTRVNSYVKYLHRSVGQLLRVR
jgi:hypothetical protein